MKTAAKNTPGMRTRTATPANTAIQIPNLVILTEVVNLREEPQVPEALEGPGGGAVSTPPLVFSQQNRQHQLFHSGLIFIINFIQRLTINFNFNLQNF